MSKLKPLKIDEVIRKLRRLGFTGPISGGKYLRMVHIKTGKIIPLPMHKGKEVSIGSVVLKAKRHVWIKRRYI